MIYPYPWNFCFSFLFCPVNVKMWFWFLSPQLWTPLLHHDFIRLASTLGWLSAREADCWYGKLLSEVVREQQETWQTHKNGRKRRKAALGFDCSAKSKESSASLEQTLAQGQAARGAKVENFMPAGQIRPTACFHGAQTHTIFFQQWIQADH